MSLNLELINRNNRSLVVYHDWILDNNGNIRYCFDIIVDMSSVFPKVRYYNVR